MRGRPPKIAELLLRIFSESKNRYSVLGDYEEEYQERKEMYGRKEAYYWYWLQVVNSIVPFIVNKIFWGMIMFNNYFKVAIRNIRRNKLYSFINIAGLAVGISCCLLIILWVQSELGFEQFHDNTSRLFRTHVEIEYSGGQIRRYTSTPGPLVDELKKRYPEIEAATHVLYYRESTFKYREKSFYENRIVFVDQDYFHLFSLPLTKGNPETALVDPFSVVISESTAQKYFGDENPIGKILRFNNKHNLKVTGVMEQYPDNTDFDFNILLPYSGRIELINQPLDQWGHNWPLTYVLLKKGSQAEELESKMSNLINEFSVKNKTTLHLQSVEDMRLYYLNGDNAAITYVYAFSIIAVFILLIACINFMNLSTARSAKRSKEIGLRKVVGVTRTQLIQQFFGESLISASVASVMAVFLSMLALPLFNSVSGKNLKLDFINDPSLLLILIGISLAAGIVSGIYPALYLSSFQPVAILKGLQSQGNRAQKFRTSLVVLQFTIAVVLIISTIVVSEQIEYISEKSLGYNKDHLLYMNLPNDDTDNYVALRSELLSVPGIVNVTRSNRRMTSNGNSSNSFIWEGKDPEFNISMNFDYADFNYLNTMEMELLQGEDFSQRYAYDDTVNVEFILNETAVKSIGLQNPIGARFAWGSREGFIKGVIKDYNFSSLHSEIRPLVLMNNTRHARLLFIRLDGKNIIFSIEHIEEIWKSMAPETPFKYGFMDERLESQYRSEKRIGKLFANFSALAIFIACLGLIGMVSFISEQRTKEIGIRKTLGGSVSEIVVMFSKDFLKWVVIANVLAWPLAYWLMNKWLDNFAFRAELSLKVFLVAGLATVFISLITISFQSMKAAFANPVESLKHE